MITSISPMLRNSYGVEKLALLVGLLRRQNVICQSVNSLFEVD